MSDTLCVKCFMMAMQNLFVFIRNTNCMNYHCDYLLEVFENYFDLIPTMRRKDIAKLKSDIIVLDSVNEKAKVCIISELDVSSTSEDIDDIQIIVSNIPILKYIIHDLKDLMIQESIERVQDLADAVHNYPEMLIKINSWSQLKYWDIYIKPYREKWDKKFLDEWKENFK